MKSKYLSLLIVLLFAFSSCKKDNKQPANILTSKTWKMGLVDENPATNPPGNILYYPVQDCDKDDTFKFTPDGNLIIDRGTDKCSLDELLTETQTYTLNRSTKELVINGVKFTLAEESTSQIKYYAQIPTPFSTNYQYLIFLLQ